MTRRRHWRDNYLLDHYSFEEFAPGYNNSGDKTGGGGGGSNAGGDGGVAAANANTGSQFLNALRRVCQIWVELAKTFGGSGYELPFYYVHAP